MREKTAAIEDNIYQYKTTKRRDRRRPTRTRGDLSRSQRRDPEKVAEAVLALIRSQPKSPDSLRNYVKLYDTRVMGVQDSVARRALHLLNLRGMVSQAVHYGGRSRGCSWQEDFFFVNDEAWS